MQCSLWNILDLLELLLRPELTILTFSTVYCLELFTHLTPKSINESSLIHTIMGLITPTLDNNIDELVRNVLKYSSRHAQIRQKAVHSTRNAFTLWQNLTLCLASHYVSLTLYLSRRH